MTYTHIRDGRVVLFMLFLSALLLFSGRVAVLASEDTSDEANNLVSVLDRTDTTDADIEPSEETTVHEPESETAVLGETDPETGSDDPSVSDAETGTTTSVESETETESVVETSSDTDTGSDSGNEDTTEAESVDDSGQEDSTSSATEEGSSDEDTCATTAGFDTTNETDAETIQGWSVRGCTEQGGGLSALGLLISAALVAHLFRPRGHWSKSVPPPTAKVPTVMTPAADSRVTRPRKVGGADFKIGEKPIDVVASITADEADACMTDSEAAERLIYASEIGGHGRMGIVNLGLISSAYTAGEQVSLADLQAKGLVDSHVDRLKILASGVLDKPLTIRADAFSLQAIKMILLVGGRAVKLSPPR